MRDAIPRSIDEQNSVGLLRVPTHPEPLSRHAWRNFVPDSGWIGANSQRPEEQPTPWRA